MPLISPFADGLENKQFIVVPEDSPIMSIRDLKGKKVGVYSMGSDGVHYSRAMAKEAGLDPMKDITLVPIGLGAQALNAIQKGTVVGGAFWDTAIALMEIQGMKFRYLSTPSIMDIVSGGIVLNTNWLSDNRSAAVKFLRALAKAEVFRKANPSASVKVHWKVFPMSKPGGGISEEQALKNMTYVLSARLRGNPPLYLWEGRVGFIPEMKWKSTMDFFFENGLIKKKVPVSQVFTNEYIAEVNQFNIQRIIDMAKNYK
jgi:NitT/TauT family transport system substrate-binding protein